MKAARYRALAVVLALAGLVACLDDHIVNQSTIEPPPPSGLIISNPVPNAAPNARARLGWAQLSEGGEVVYVSLTPGTAPTGTHAIVHPLGDPDLVTTAVIAGGFDPVPVAAQTGDTIAVQVLDANEHVVFEAKAAVAAARPPVVVRTDPPPQKRDVPLNASIVIVFSEPVDTNTITTSTVKLLRGTTAVAGTVRLLAGTATDAVLIPDAPLDAATDYQLVVTQGVADLDGDSLVAPDTADFTTEPAGGAPVQLRFTIPPSNTFAGSVIAPAVQITALDSNGNKATGFYGSVIVALGSSNGTASLAGTTTTTAVAGVATFGDLRIDQPGSGYTLTAMAAGLPATTSGTFEIVTPAPGSSSIVFVNASTLDGNNEIYTINSDGSGGVNLTHNPASDNHPMWSPDGAKIAFNSSRDVSPGIYVMNADGSGQVKLPNSAPGGIYAWSPDGSKILFGSNRDGNPSNLYVMQADGSGVTRLTHDSAVDVEATWSPDGSKIAFVSTNALGVQIFVINADGSGLVALTSDSHDNGEPAWSPDGSKIAFVDNAMQDGALHVMNADGTGVTTLPAGGSYPTWSPDGSKLAFQVTHRTSRAQCSQSPCTHTFHVINADGSGLVQLIPTPSPGGYVSGVGPVWSPDGSRLAVVVGGGIDVVRADGSGLVTLTNSEASWWSDPAWKPR